MNVKVNFVLIVLTTTCCIANSKAQTNKSLSNLTAPTAINQSLLPNTTNAINLGSTILGWKDLYLFNGLFLRGKIVLHSPGSGNFFAGTNAGNASVTGSYNQGTGLYALHNITTGNSNTAHGPYSLYSNNTGDYNTAIGHSALRFNSRGIRNTAVGYDALHYSSTAFDNTATGSQALKSNTTGSSNTANGSQALLFNTTGIDNTAVGSGALTFNTTGTKNTATGSLVMSFNKTGYNNTASGYRALYGNESGYNNVATGLFAMYANRTGKENTASGYQTLQSNHDGHNNTADGAFAMNYNTIGSYNTANGSHALYNSTTSYDNTATGAYALYNNTTGNQNTAIGYAADVSANYLNNATAIGAYARVDASNKVRIGNASVTSIGGQVGWTTFSDGRYKRNIKENVSGLLFIKSLRPVTYTVDTKSLNEYYKRGNQPGENMKAETDGVTDESGNTVYTGFVAQEVEAAANKSGYSFSGVDKPKNKEGLYGLRYDNFVVPLVKAVQELSKQNEELEKKIEQLQSLLVSCPAVNNQQLTIISSASLEQNTPNPFSGKTSIRYYIPPKFGTAKILVADANGRIIKETKITSAGEGLIHLQAAALSAGNYAYSLILDGNIISSKKMMLTR